MLCIPGVVLVIKGPGNFRRDLVSVISPEGEAKQVERAEDRSETDGQPDELNVRTHLR